MLLNLHELGRVDKVDRDLVYLDLGLLHIQSVVGTNSSIRHLGIVASHQHTNSI